MLSSIIVAVHDIVSHVHVALLALVDVREVDVVQIPAGVVAADLDVRGGEVAVLGADLHGSAVGGLDGGRRDISLAEVGIGAGRADHGVGLPVAHGDSPDLGADHRGPVGNDLLSPPA